MYFAITSMVAVLAVQAVAALTLPLRQNAGNSQRGLLQENAPSATDSGGSAAETMKREHPVRKECSDWMPFRCPTKCIPRDYICDGANDCDDGSDEASCSRNRVHPFRCGTGEVVRRAFACDREDDCDDGSDEVNCYYSNSTTTRPSPTSKRRAASTPRHTPRHAPRRTRSTTTTQAATVKREKRSLNTTCDSPDTFRCPTGCIPEDWVCDYEDDCGDGSDEVNCSFQCSTGIHIPKEWICDNMDDCGDGSDEVNCNLSSEADNQDALGPLPDTV